MKAGQLEIELIANVARLQADMDKVKKSVGDMTKDVGAKVNAANDNMARLGRGMAATAPSARMAAFGMRNMAFQVQDLGVQFATAANSSDPLRMSLMALAMQGPQIRDAFKQTGMSAAGMVGHFVKAHPILAALTVAAGVGAVAFKTFANSIDRTGELNEYAKGLGLTADEMKKLSSTSVTFGDVMKGVWKTIYDGLDLGPKWAVFSALASRAWWKILEGAKIAVAGIYAGFVGNFRAIGILWNQLPGVIAEGTIAAANFAISAIEGMINKAIALLNSAIEEANKLAAKVGLDGFDKIAEVSAKRMKNPLSGAVAGMAADLNSAFADAYAEAMAGLDRLGGTLRDNILGASRDRMDAEAAAIIADRKGDKRDRANRAKKEGLSDAEKAYLDAVKAAMEYAAALDKETASIGKSTIELKHMEIAAAAAAAPTDKLRSMILAAGRAWEQAFRANADNEFQKNIIAPMERELQLLGLTGTARELRALALEEEAFKAEMTAAGVNDVNAAWQRYLDLQTKLIKGRSVLERDAEAAQILQQELQRMIGLMSNLGGVGGMLGAVLGLATGQSGAVSGPLGDLLNIVTGTKADPGNPDRQIAKTLADELREIFKLNGEFGRTMSDILQGAGTGMLAANALGFNGKGGQIGSALGGALGKVAGEAIGKTVGGTLGKALGPLGSIAGGLLGGALGSLLSGTPKGSATIGNVNGSLGVSGTAGNSNSRIAAASKSANAIIGSLESIASQLGASIDPSKGSVSIGIRNGSFRVDPTGKGATKLKKGAIDFGEDAEAAAYYAMMDLIKDGVLQGLRAGTERLLRNADDLEAGLAKALKFEGVFKDLASFKDPMKFALDELTAEFEQLRKIFTEAGASAEEYAQLEELLTLKREEAIERARQDALDKISERRELEIRILELLGKEQEALAAGREMELASLKASLRPLQSMIYQLEDARAIMARFEPLTADLRAFKQELLGGETSNSFAVLTARFREIAALAKGGDADALGKLRGSATEYLDAAKENARSALDYRRAVGEVLAATENGIFAADTQIEYAQLQIDAIAAQSNILVGIKDQLESSQAAIASNTAKTATLLQRFEGDGLTVKTDTDTPLFIRLPTGERLQVEVV